MLAMSELFYSDMMSFSGSQSKGGQKMVEKQLGRIKTHLGRSPQGVFGVHYYLLAGYARSHSLTPVAARSLAPVAARSAI